VLVAVKHSNGSRLIWLFSQTAFRRRHIECVGDADHPMLRIGPDKRVGGDWMAVKAREVSAWDPAYGAIAPGLEDVLATVCQHVCDGRAPSPDVSRTGRSRLDAAAES
jgi:hypothetical protein